MDAESMTTEELYALAQSKEDSGAEARTLDIEGLAVTVYPAKARTWKAYRILRDAMHSPDDMQRFDALLALVAFATSVDEEAIIAHCGGDDASVEDVVRVASKIVAECTPKN